jgi:hypothetical protein
VKIQVFNSVEVFHPQLSHHGHPVDSALVGGWFTLAAKESMILGVYRSYRVFNTYFDDRIKITITLLILSFREANTHPHTSFEFLHHIRMQGRSKREIKEKSAKADMEAHELYVHVAAQPKLT